MWIAELILETVRDGLAGAAGERDTEQAVAGLDALDELALHAVVRDTLMAAGYGVWPEERYPAQRGKRRRSEGRRCDLVLTRGDQRLAEPGVQDSLYSTGEIVPPAEAFWLEIKTLRQFGPEGPNRNYSGWLLGEVPKDVPKLAGDAGIEHAALLVILFARDLITARHDLHTWHMRCRAQGMPVSTPEIGGFAINDRLGNTYAAVALFPVRPGLQGAVS